MPQLVLASTSPYRKALLERLDLPFETCAPDIDEERQDDESPQELVARLSESKARAVANKYPDALIIGSDQVAILNNQILGKPGNHQTAVEQLRNASGRRVVFVTGLSLLDVRSNRCQTSVIPYTVVFRNLSAEDIESYLHHEKP